MYIVSRSSSSSLCAGGPIAGRCLSKPRTLLINYYTPGTLITGAASAHRQASGKERERITIPNYSRARRRSFVIRKRRRESREKIGERGEELNYSSYFTIIDARCCKLRTRKCRSENCTCAINLRNKCGKIEREKGRKRECLLCSRVKFFPNS